MEADLTKYRGRKMELQHTEDAQWKWFFCWENSNDK